MTGKTAEKLRSLLKTYDERSAARPPAEVRTAPDEAERRRRAGGGCDPRMGRDKDAELHRGGTEGELTAHRGVHGQRTQESPREARSSLRRRPQSQSGPCRGRAPQEA